MNKYYIDYVDTNNDLCHVWLKANSKKDAENTFKHEYWDVKHIISISKT